jgi:hypothetical protein
MGNFAYAFFIIEFHSSHSRDYDWQLKNFYRRITAKKMPKLLDGPIPLPGLTIKRLHRTNDAQITLHTHQISTVIETTTPKCQNAPCHLPAICKRFLLSALTVTFHHYRFCRFIIALGPQFVRGRTKFEFVNLHIYFVSLLRGAYTS